jgi:hypothetical protein
MGKLTCFFKSLFSAAPGIWEIEPDLLQELVNGREFL